MAEPTPAFPKNHTLKAQFSGTLSGGHWTNRLWFEVAVSGTPTSANVTTLMGLLAAQFHTSLMPHLATDLIMTQAKGTYYATGPEISVEGVNAEAFAGSIGGSLPASVAAVIDWHIADFYRGGHPRSYMAGVPASHVELDKQLTAADQAALAADANAFIGGVNAITSTPFTSVQLVCQRFFSGHAVISPPITFPITGATVRRVLGTQRRRLGKNL